MVVSVERAVPRAEWRPAVLPRPRRERRAADLILGVVLPWTMLGLDRALFGSDALLGGSLFSGSVLGDWLPAACAGTAAFTAVLCSWITLGRAPGIHAGFLGAGFLFACLVGLSLLPLSFIGAFFAGVGLLGLSPFLIAWPYLRCAGDAWRARPAPSYLAAIAGFVLALSLPVAAQLGTERAFADALVSTQADDPGVREEGVDLLRWLRHVRSLDPVVSAYEGAGDATQRQRLGEAFREVTGWEIESWLAMRND